MSERKWIEGYPEANVKVLLTDGESIEVGYYDGYDIFHGDWQSGLQFLNEEKITHHMDLPPFPKNGGDWSEGFPRPGATILLTDGNEMEVGYYNSVDGFCDQHGEEYLMSMEVEDITHWMSLPPLPGEE